MQKKIWWCCAVSAAVAVFTINLAADHAVRYPDSFVGRAVVSAYNGNVVVVRALATPVVGVGTFARDMVGALQTENPNAVNEGAPNVSAVADPTPMPNGSADVCETPARQPGSIHFDGTLPTIVEQPIEEFPVVKDEESTTPGRICPPLDLNDRMPYVEEEEAGTQGQNGMPPDCREDPKRDTQYPGCPTDGCPYPCAPKTQTPINGIDTPDGTDDTEPWLPPQQKKGTRYEDNLERERTDAKGTKKFSWLQRLRKRLMDSAASRNDIDTMEFRPTDALPFDLGPNPY
jgi:hypothetical protein